MFEGTRAIDWLMLVIEALVLILISWEGIVSEKRHRKEQRRQTTVRERVLELSRLMDKGQRIKSGVPDPAITNPQLVTPWKDSVEAWSEETNTFLAGHSSRASSSFMLVTDAVNMDSVVYSSGRQFALTGDFREFYQQFVVRLANLRRIVEQADAYF